ncbi:PIN domain-containing protein [Cellulomonas sp. NPDC089187]|uniref:type II toxin-antitoxin system VapC family toxin n=1 Tax=Cellulomonas sp. NPDC089187 TaxID=3154970 RepID=UPI00343C482F
MIVLDASVLIALLEPTDAHHQRAITDLAGLNGELGVHPVTMAEILVAPFKVGLAPQVRADLASISVREVTPGPDHPMVLAEIRTRDRLRMPDACVLALAVEQDSPLVTFDQRLAAAARSRALLFGA